MNLRAALARALAPLSVRVRLVVSRAILRAVDEAHKVRELQLTALAGETLGRVQHFQHFGLSSRPPVGAEVVIVCPQGARDLAVAIAEEHGPSRPQTLAAGESMLYAVGAARVHVRADGSVLITAPAGVTVSADFEAGGEVADAIGTLDALRQAYNVHTHPDPQGGSTGPPVPTV